MMDWLGTFALTLGVELVVAVPLLGIIEASWRMRVRLVVVANLCTHPLVYVATLACSGAPIYPVAVLALEAGATLVEALVYARAFGRRDWLPALFTSCFANAASLVVSVGAGVAAATTV